MDLSEDYIKKKRNGKNSMDYKKEIENFLNEIQNEKFLKFLYNVIVYFKRGGVLIWITRKKLLRYYRR